MQNALLACLLDYAAGGALLPKKLILFSIIDVFNDTEKSVELSNPEFCNMHLKLPGSKLAGSKQQNDPIIS